MKREKVKKIILSIACIWILATLLAQYSKEVEVKHATTQHVAHEKELIKWKKWKTDDYSGSVQSEQVRARMSQVFHHRPDGIPSIDCESFISKNEDSVLQSKLLLMEFNSQAYKPKRLKFDNFEEELLNRASNCEDFRKWRNYINIPLSKEEIKFPIAYIITIHKKVRQFELLLRAIYRPNNIHCVHVDRKSPQKFKDDVAKIVRCLPNVFVASDAVELIYTHYSRVEADLVCMKQLIERRNQVKWKYVINLCGQDFPLKTNYDIVKSLQMLNGMNNLETVTMPGHKSRRYKFKFKVPANKGYMEKTDEEKGDNPLGIKMFAGSAYYVFTYEAVDFIVNDERVKEFMKWNEDTYSPDEHIWASLQRWYPVLPGSYPPHPKYDRNELVSIPRLVKWAGLDDGDSPAYPKCEGRYVRGVCVYGVGDLSWMLTQGHLFANKFDVDADVFAVACLDEWVFNRTKLQVVGR